MSTEATTTTTSEHHGLTRGQSILVIIGIVLVLIGVGAALQYATARPNLKGRVLIVDSATNQARPLGGVTITLVQQKYGAVKTIKVNPDGTYSARAEVETYKLKVTGCPYQAHSYVTLMLGLVTTRDITCLTSKPAN